jgi:SAM-dependent methyltransferase
MTKSSDSKSLSAARDILQKLPENELLDVLVEMAKARAESLPPSEGLKFLFSLDAALYPIQGWLSVAYGGGVHTKHRHTRYHDFFVNRVRRGERVLDIGCGIGALAYDVAVKAGATLVGIDLSMQNVSTATRKHSHPDVTYVVGDILRSPLKGPFDTVILSNVVEHLQRRAEFLRSVVHEVQPSRFLLRVPVFERDWRVPLKEELGIDSRLDATHFIEYTLESFAEEIDAAGLAVTHQEVRWGEIWAEAVPVAVFSTGRHSNEA